MDHDGISYSEALREAKQKGYAEKDPTLDVDGTDSAQKLSILARSAFGVDFNYEDISCEGIRRIDLRDIQYARELGYAVKLLAIGKNHPREIELRVHPTLVPRGHPLGVVDGVFNAVSLKGDAVGECLFYGRGAGMMPTASAVVADLVDVATGSLERSFSRLGAFWGEAPRRRIRNILDTRGKYYLRFLVTDRPGVLGKISTILGHHHISILSVMQKEVRRIGPVPLVVMTHEARERDVGAALRQIDALDVVKGKTVTIRVES
jgi:homoserine dehydrogenase